MPIYYTLFRKDFKVVSEKFNYSYQQTYKKVHDAETEIFKHIKK